MNAPTAEPQTAARRLAWATRRAEMEARDEKHTPFGRRRRRWDYFKRAIKLFGGALKISGLYAMGARNALDVRLRALELMPSGLPAAFDGYRILHITDPHFDGLPGLAERIVALVRPHSVDLAVLTGDYRWRVHGEFRQVLPPLQCVVGAISARDGILATLGNHDEAAMAEGIEALGIRLLVNESLTIRRGSAALHVTGLDDVHYFYTAAAAAALTSAPAGCRIALVHSPEAAHLAAAAGYALYLCGHTHGGQVCLPGGLPVLTNSAFHWRHVKGVWRRGAMLGYTSNGAGTSGLPVRFFARGEVTLLTLRAGKA